jgi:hypothetical protein
MSQYSAQNITVTVAGSQIYATNATASSSKSVEAVRTLGNLLSQGMSTTGPVETTISIEYYIQANDPIKSIADTILSAPVTYGNGIGSIINIGNATINKCYLTSYSLTAESNSLVTASASFISRASSQSLVMGLNTAPAVIADLKFAHGGASNSTLVSKATSFTYECSFEWEPIILMGKLGEPEPGVLFNGGSQSLNVKGIGAGGTVTYCPQTQTASASVAQLCGGGGSLTLSVTNGDITASEVSAAVGGFQEGSITVTRQL